MNLTRRVVEATGLPAVAAGGVDGPESFAGLLRAGAAAVAVGTLLLRTDKSGASSTHRDALVSPELAETVVVEQRARRETRTTSTSGPGPVIDTPERALPPMSSGG